MQLSWEKGGKEKACDFMAEKSTTAELILSMSKKRMAKRKFTSNTKFPIVLDVITILQSPDIQPLLMIDPVAVAINTPSGCS